ncbi:MAG TPA: chromosome segregation protein SMC, partial [Woeseiaceae bacterium]|nr:chromosome segregation protein SMC [Woeseiaceae bacterium]
ISHTRENLDRLKDLLEEVEKHIKHLDRQAKTAERYGRLKEEERRTAAELLALRIHDLDERSRASTAIFNEKETALQATVADQRKVESRIEEIRVRQTDAADDFNEIQGRFYRSGAEIARLEQAIEHSREIRERQKLDLEQAIQGAREIAEHINKDQSEIAQLDLSLSELIPGLEQARAAEQRSVESLRRAEQALVDWQEQWDDYTLRSNEMSQICSVEQTRTEQIESRIRSLGERRRKLDEAEPLANISDLKSAFEKLTVQEQRKRHARDEFDRHLTDITEKIQKLREQDVKLTRLVDERRTVLQVSQSRLASLEAVQMAALGQSDEAIQSWLEACEIDGTSRVAQTLEVEAGWERAVETVLGEYLQAICVRDAASAAAHLAKLRDGTATLLVERPAPGSGDTSLATLASKVTKAPAAVLDILRNVRVADSLPKALAIREQLEDALSVVTQDGIWLSRNWLRVRRDKDTHAGVLAREHEIRRLKGEIRELQARADSARKLAQDGRTRLMQLEERRDTLQKDSAALLSEYSETKSALDAARYQLDQANARRAALADESAEIEREQYAAVEQLRSSSAQHKQAVSRLGELAQHREMLDARREELRADLQRVRAQADQDRQAVQDMAIQFESRRTSKESAALSLQRMESQRRLFKNREQDISQQLAQSEEPLARNKLQLEKQLQVRLEVESELGASRRKVEGLESELRELDQKRMQLDQAAEIARTEVGEARMAVQEIRVRREGLTEQFDKTGFEMDVLVQSLDSEASIVAWEEKLERTRSRIERLGPINLAAIDEFKEQSERKAYLDSQLADLNDALATLEGAIRKIDRETRTRFRETFTNIDSGFKRLFPKLFGGGHAYLEMTGDDLLTAGVTVMARPPGKRNSTIHLLSGGEKALTAVALVFAIFELNPAPFCLLDEVDAPLDDANVGRFCDIVKEMSSMVQFVFITHNKVTMEMARQLTGVTMQEPGVSRFVAVDLDEAVKMAAS